MLSALHAELVHQGQVQIRQGNILQVRMPPALEIPRAASRQHERNVHRRMRVTVRDPGPVNHGYVVHQRAIAVARGAQLVEQIREHLHVIRVDLRRFRNLLGLVLMVRDRMVRVGHADLRICHTALLMPEHERDHAGHIALISQNHQVEHQLEVVFPTRGNSRGTLHFRQFAILLFRDLDAPLDPADRVEILGQLRAIGGRQSAAEARRFRIDRIEQALLLTRPRRAFFGVRAARIREQPLEHEPRIVLRRQRRARTGPAQRIRVRARVAGIATARCLAGFNPQLERRDLGLLADFLREDLVHRDACVEPRFAGGRRDIGQETRAGLRVRATWTPRRRDTSQPAQNLEMFAEWLRVHSASG